MGTSHPHLYDFRVSSPSGALHVQHQVMSAMDESSADMMETALGTHNPSLTIIGSTLHLIGKSAASFQGGLIRVRKHLRNWARRADRILARNPSQHAVVWKRSNSVNESFYGGADQETTTNIAVDEYNEASLDVLEKYPKISIWSSGRQLIQVSQVWI